MAKPGRRAGQNIRELELKRRLQAISAFGGAVLVLGVPLVLSSSANLPLISWIVLVVIALWLTRRAAHHWKWAGYAAQGARGEEEVARELAPLEEQGWQLEYGLSLGYPLGDADIICISPRGKAYVIDVKSHRGEVIAKEDDRKHKRLHRRLGDKTFPFEKDFLEKMLQQASAVQKQKHLNLVTPILAFSQAKVSLPAPTVGQVYVVEKSSLVALLKSLG
ncbi:MAG: nuclease-related domain-containing protein [Thermostichales cyanobacterium BF4_bins_65]